jgi:hypothetical protein
MADETADMSVAWTVARMEPMKVEKWVLPKAVHWAEE